MEPKVGLDEGLELTIAWHRRVSAGRERETRCRAHSDAAAVGVAEQVTVGHSS